MNSKKKRIKKFRAAIRKLFPGVMVLVKGLALTYSRRSFLRKSGYIRSVRTKLPCRPDGSPLPWMNYAMIAFLEDRLNRDQDLFEYGSGNSTLFFAGRVGSVISVETDPKWYDYFVDKVPENVTLLPGFPFDGQTYSRIIDKQNKKFDVVVVDAEERNDCLFNVESSLSDRGVVILDDTQGPVTEPGIRHLLDRGFKRLDFEGLKPGGIRAYRTTVFYKSGNCFGI